MEMSQRWASPANRHSSKQLQGPGQTQPRKQGSALPEASPPKRGGRNNKKNEQFIQITNYTQWQKKLR